MNTFNKKSLYAAIAGVSALGVAGTAEAVHVNPDGLGQVLIYPYYTVRTRDATVFTNPQYNSLLSVVNSTASAKAVKVRFLEGKDSRKCSTSTSTCRRTTSGPRASSRRPTAPAS